MWRFDRLTTNKSLSRHEGKSLNERFCFITETQLHNRNHIPVQWYRLDRMPIFRVGILLSRFGRLGAFLRPSGGSECQFLHFMLTPIGGLNYVC